MRPNNHRLGVSGRWTYIALDVSFQYKPFVVQEQHIHVHVNGVLKELLGIQYGGAHPLSPKKVHVDIEFNKWLS